MRVLPVWLMVGLASLSFGCSASTSGGGGGGEAPTGAGAGGGASTGSTGGSDTSSTVSSSSTTGGEGGAGSTASAGGAGGLGGAGGEGGAGAGGEAAQSSSSLSSSSSGTPVVPSDVDVVITADNAYSFGYGTVDAINTYVAGARATTAGQIFLCSIGPEAYTVPGADAPTNGYLYIVSWDDASVTQGVIGQFSRDGATIYTGDPRFEVCATGIATYNGTTNGPGQADVNEQIARCNAGGDEAQAWSRGWVNLTEAVTPGALGKLAVGEANDPGTGGNFPEVCPAGNTAGAPGLDPAAHWMWYNTGSDTNPFKAGGGNRYHAYLIFRLRAGIIHI